MSRAFTQLPSVNAIARVGNSNRSQAKDKVDKGSSTSTNSSSSPGAIGRGRTSSLSTTKTKKTNNTVGMYNNINNSQRRTNPRMPGFDEPASRPRPGEDQGGAEKHPQNNSGEPSGSQGGGCATGYTKFEANQKKRQQITAMARRETEEYERYKQQNSLKYCNYVGTTGGGQITEDVVRRRQANDVKNQKFNRLQNQQKLRDERKASEQREIDGKRADARKKADDNARREKAVNADEIRIKREGFLRQLESQSKSSNNVTHRTANNAPQICGPSSSSRTHQDFSYNENEEDLESDEDELVSEDVMTLIEMFPQMDLNYLKGLYNEMGSVDAVTDIIS